MNSSYGFTRKTSFSRLALLTLTCITEISWADTTQRFQPDDTQDIERPAFQQVHLDQQGVQLAGLQTSKLVTTQYSHQHLLSVSVINTLPLLTLKQQRANTDNKLKLSKQQLALTQQNLQRAQQLFQNGVGNQTRVRQLQSELLIKQAVIKDFRNEKQQLTLKYRQHWGATLAQDQASTAQLLESLQSTSQVLLLVTLPVGIQLPASVNTMTFSPLADQATPLVATLVSASPFNNPRSPGATFFFRSANHPLLRPGTVLDGWMNTKTESQTGVMIPDSAVIWHAGQAWVYIETAANIYSRRALNNAQATDQHWFVSTGFSPGEKLVTQGAALLLSEEFRWQIPAEDDD